MDLGLQLISILLVGGILSWGFGFVSQRLAWKWNITDKPSGGRKIHTKETPLLGGVGIACAITLAVVVLWHLGWFAQAELSRGQLISFLVGIAIIVLTGVLDDKFNLSGSIRFSFYTVAALVVVLSGSSIAQVTNPSGDGAVSLVWGNIYGWIRYPADFLALGWMLAVMLAVKFVDGLDGLVTGQTIIGSAVIGGLALSVSYFQPAVALLAMVVLACFLGFFPHNQHPAKQFLGESGSVLAGYCLAFLSIVSGTKVATALMVLGLPLIDIVLVMAGRLRRGIPPWQGDKTHLHHKLLAVGLSQPQAVGLLWLISMIFGLAGLGLQTRGKFMLLIGLFILTLCLSFITGWLAKRRKAL